MFVQVTVSLADQKPDFIISVIPRYEVAAEECKSLVDESFSSASEQKNHEDKKPDKDHTFSPDVSELLVNEVFFNPLMPWSSIKLWVCSHRKVEGAECA